jgi:hypothetical protein
VKNGTTFRVRGRFECFLRHPGKTVDQIEVMAPDRARAPLQNSSARFYCSLTKRPLHPGGRRLRVCRGMNHGRAESTEPRLGARVQHDPAPPSTRLPHAPRIPPGTRRCESAVAPSTRAPPPPSGSPPVRRGPLSPPWPKPTVFQCHQCTGQVQPLDAAPVWEDPRARRATRVASDVIRRTVQGSAAMGSGRRLGGGVSRRHGRCDLTRKHLSYKPQGLPEALPSTCRDA